MGDLVAEGPDEAVAVGTIGGRVAVWRRRRGLGRDELGALAGVSGQRIGQWEQGECWVDRRGELSALARGLRVEAGELTGQPYEPVGEEHTAVRAAVFRLRRLIGGPPGTAGEPGNHVDPAPRTALAAEAAGDEHALAEALPELIAAGGSPRADLLAAGLLRRLGYGDLAWLHLNRARSGSGTTGAVLREEIRILLALGQPGHAEARATPVAADAGDAADAELLVLLAVARAAGGRRPEAEDALAAAARRAGDEQALAGVAVAGVAVAVEYGAPDEALDRARTIRPELLSPVTRTRLRAATAAAAARLGDFSRAGADLLAAEAETPLRLRLDPLVRELITALPDRVPDGPPRHGLRLLAERSGLGRARRLP